MYRIANRAPDNIGASLDTFHNEASEMNYEVFECLISDLEEGPRAVSHTLYIVAADHDAVGLVTYYECPRGELSALREGD